jgi:hypothetical protein
MPSFWSDPTLEPKRKYRFMLRLDNSSAYVVTKVKNPALKISETPHKFLNHTFYYPGRVEWDPIDISFVDPSGPDDQSDNLYNRLFESGYDFPKIQNEGLYGLTKKLSVEGGVGNVVIEQLGDAQADGKLQAIAEWHLYNPFFTNITWGDFDYSGEEMLECTTTIRYDYAEYINLLA